jgi:hypothetical protein
VIRFFAYGDGLNEYKDRPSEFLFFYAKRMNKSFADDSTLSDEYRSRFIDMVSFVASVFPNGFRRAATGKATPRARFEAIAIGSFLALQAQPQLRKRLPNVEQWLHGDEEFMKITGSDGANAIARLRARINFVRDRLLGA